MFNFSISTGQTPNNSGSVSMGFGLPGFQVATCQAVPTVSNPHKAHARQQAEQNMANYYSSKGFTQTMNPHDMTQTTTITSYMQSQNQPQQPNYYNTAMYGSQPTPQPTTTYYETTTYSNMYPSTIPPPSQGQYTYQPQIQPQPMPNYYVQPQVIIQPQPTTFVQPLMPQVVIQTHHHKTKCPKCNGLGGFGAFGACSKTDVHFRKDCHVCGGSKEFYAGAVKCPKCAGAGGWGAFGACELGDVHFRSNCPTCSGKCYLPPGTHLHKCHECNGLGGMGAFGPCELSDVHFRAVCGSCHGKCFK